MTIKEFARIFLKKIKEERIRTHIKNETEFERKFIIPLVTKISPPPNIWVCCHPWGGRRSCMPDCETVHNKKGKVEIGCWKCWKQSKKWSSVAAFGTHHDFDLVAKDKSGNTLIIEIKFLSEKNGRMPNGEIQRFLGQCALAATKHNIVIGVCGYRGSFNPKWNKDTNSVKKWAQQNNIDLVLRKVD